MRSCIRLAIVILMSSTVLLIAEPSLNRELCFTSHNSRGKVFFLHIHFDRNNTPRSIRYKGSPTAIVLSHYGRQQLYLPDIGETRNATMYLETYRNEVTGKLYILDTPLYNGIYVAFVRMKDNRFFYFKECM